jgi:cell division transport system ATP-binding protein
MIQFQNVSKHYENHTALRSLSFLIDKGEMVFVTGPSGSGKTTMLKLIYLAERQDEGNVTVAGHETAKLKESSIPMLRRNIGFVFQDFRLLHNRDVFENVAIALRIRGTHEKDIKARVFDSLKLVTLRHKSDSYPDALSGGEQQRVAIARAVVTEPTVILADEPTGNIDPDLSAGIIRIFKDINAKGTTILIATHNRDLFRDSGKRVLRLDSGNLVSDEVQ